MDETREITVLGEIEIAVSVMKYTALILLLDCVKTELEARNANNKS